jgi:SNF2 family DNA or RNA helicase
VDYAIKPVHAHSDNRTSNLRTECEFLHAGHGHDNGKRKLSDEHSISPQFDCRTSKRARKSKDYDSAAIGEAEQSSTKGKEKTPKQRTIGLSDRSMVGDVAIGQSRAPQPTFSTDNRRDDALKDLIGNVPESQKRNARKDVPWFKEACRSFTGYRSLEPENGAWSLKGMKTTLQNHQVIPVGFMRKRESGGHLPKSGILSDQMGLEKTVVALACIVNGRPCKQPGWIPDPEGNDENMPQTTSIVVPKALLKQWFDEISRHCDQVRKRSD